MKTDKMLASAHNQIIGANPPNRLGTVDRPDFLSRLPDPEAGGIGILLSLFFRILVVAAAVYALFNFVLAGYAFMSAGDDPQKVAGAWAKIYQTIIGLVVAAGALVLASVVSRLIFGTWNVLTNPTIPTIR